MRMAMGTLSIAGAICLLCWQSAGALPAVPGTMKEAANAASVVQKAYYQHYHRHYFTKCYHELVIGPYRCHRFYRW